MRVYIIVVGCGRVGAKLGTSLVAAGHEVTVIDKRAEAFRRLPDGWGGRTVVGIGFDRTTLVEADVARADALAAVTSGDNSNVVTARVAREHFEVPHVVARIYDPRRAVVYQRLGIPTVATVTWTVDQVTRRLFPEETAIEWSDPSGHLILVERALPRGFVGRPLDGLEVQDRCRLVSVERTGAARVAQPGMIGQEGDILYLAVRKDALDQLNATLEGDV